MDQIARRWKVQTRAGLQTCIGSGYRFSETDWKEFDVISVCCSTYCLRRDEVWSCVFVELDLTACLDFSCLYMFHSIFTAFFMRQLLAQCFGYQIALKIASRSGDINGNGVSSSVVGFDS